MLRTLLKCFSVVWFARALVSATLAATSGVAPPEWWRLAVYEAVIATLVLWIVHIDKDL